MAIQNYKDPIAWQKGMELVVEVYRVTDSFPRNEVFGLTNQLRRAAVSIPSNIAEGQGRSTTKDFCNFLHVAKGSLQEVETQLLIAGKLLMINEQQVSEFSERIAELGRILNGLIRSLSH